MKLFVHKTVKCEVINADFISRDLPLNNSAMMVKWKCILYYTILYYITSYYIILLYSSKRMCEGLSVN